MSIPTHALVRFAKNNASGATTIVEVNLIQAIKHKTMSTDDHMNAKTLYAVKKSKNQKYEMACIYTFGSYKECKAKQDSGPRKKMTKYRPSEVNKTIMDLSQDSTVLDDIIDDDDDVAGNEKTTYKASKKQATQKSKQNRKSTGTNKAAKKKKSTGRKSDPNTLGSGLKKSQFLKLNNTSDSTIKNVISDVNTTPPPAMVEIPTSSSHCVTPKGTQQHMFDTGLVSSKSMANDTPLSTNGGKFSNSRHGRRPLGDVTPLSSVSSKSSNSRHGRGHLEDATLSSPERIPSPFKQRTPLAPSPPRNRRNDVTPRNSHQNSCDPNIAPRRLRKREVHEIWTKIYRINNKDVNVEMLHLGNGISITQKNWRNVVRSSETRLLFVKNLLRNMYSGMHLANRCVTKIKKRILQKVSSRPSPRKEITPKKKEVLTENLRIFLTDFKKSLLKKDEDLQRALLDVGSALTQEISQTVQSIKKGENVSTQEPMMVEEDSDPYETF